MEEKERIIEVIEELLIKKGGGDYKDSAPSELLKFIEELE